MDKNTILYRWTEKNGGVFSQFEIDVIAHRIYFINLFLKNKRNIKLLDVGAGSGIMSSFLEIDSDKYFCLELVSENIDNLKKMGVKNIVQADCLNIPFKPKSFEFVMAMAMIYYVNFVDFIKEVSTVISDSGTLVFCTSNPQALSFEPAIGTNRYYSISELNTLLLQYGFKAEFYGFFEDIFIQRKYNYLHQLKTLLKFFKFHLFFSIIWNKLRIKFYGGKVFLDNKTLINSLNFSSYVKGEELNVSSYNKIYKVIYCVAIFKGR